MTDQEAGLRAVEDFARDVAHLHRRHAVPAFHAYAMRQGWLNTPMWLEARARFTATWRNARNELHADKAGPELGNEWREEWRDQWHDTEWRAA